MSRGEARVRIAQTIESFSVAEPLFFWALSTHASHANESLETIRVGKGRLEYREDFIGALSDDQLRAVLSVEAMRVLLTHPYQRRMPNPEWMIAASNLTVQEYLRTDLPLPRARELFDGDDHDRQFYEYYYAQLQQRTESSSSNEQAEPSEQSPDSGNDGESSNGENHSAEPGDIQDELHRYANPERIATDNTELWDQDDLRRDETMQWIRDADADDRWGSIGPIGKERLRATLRPRLNYRHVLRQFRQSIRSQSRQRTRMKPSRRYEFDQLGSRYNHTTRLLFAVDVSGSMSSEDVSKGLSVIRGFFQHAVEAIEVVMFDSEIRSPVLNLRKMRDRFDIEGRGGTNFQCVIDLMEQGKSYDGAIIYTDGCAPAPRRSSCLRTPLVWLFPSIETLHDADSGLRGTGELISLTDTVKGPR